MNALARGQLKPGKDVDWAIAGSGSEGRNSADTIVICYGKRLDAEFNGLIDNCLCMADLVFVGRLPTEGAGVIMWVYLKCAPIEACSSGRPRVCDGISCSSHSLSIPARHREGPRNQVS